MNFIYCMLFNVISFSVQILAFYLVFYSLLIAFWIGCLAIFLSTLDDKVPRYYGKGTIIGVNPGLFFSSIFSSGRGQSFMRGCSMMALVYLNFPRPYLLVFPPQVVFFEDFVELTEKNYLKKTMLIVNFAYLSGKNFRRWLSTLAFG